MKKTKDIFVSLILIGILITILIYREDILCYLMRYYSTYDIKEQTNEYTKGQDFVLFQRTSDFTPENKQELVNILFTILDDGMTSFTFNCDYNCNDDIKSLTDEGYLDAMNNYVHPYNSYNRFDIAVSNYNIVNVSIRKNYNDVEIELINQKVQEIYSGFIKKSINKYDLIKEMHDYIINTTSYDSDAAALIQNKDTENLKSHKAYTVFFQGKAVCGGYTDAMAIFLNKLNLKNFKISNDSHIWNAVEYEGVWYNVDLTWDDPIIANGKDALIHDYFMITKDQLKNKNDEKHSYNDEVYQELN